MNPTSIGICPDLGVELDEAFDTPSLQKQIPARKLSLPTETRITVNCTETRFPFQAVRTYSGSRLEQQSAVHTAVHREYPMSDSAFDTLGAARSLKAAGLGAEQADAIVEVMSQSANQFVTVQHFDAGIAVLHSRIDALQTELRTRTNALQTELSARTDAIQTKLNTRIDAFRADLRAEIWRSILIAVGVLIAANALMMTALGIVLTGGALPS